MPNLILLTLVPMRYYFKLLTPPHHWPTVDVTTVLFVS